MSSTMPRSLKISRRSPRRVGLVLIAAAALTLAACTVPSNAPEAYGDAVRENFVTGCTGSIPETNNTTTSLAPTDYCNCAYEAFEALVPFNDAERSDSQYAGYPADAPTFTSFNDELSSSDDPASVWSKLPANVQERLNSCPLPAPAPLASTTTTSAGGAESGATSTTAAP